MIKRIIWIAFLLVLTGTLVYGAINRSLAKDGREVDHQEEIISSSKEENLEILENSSSGESAQRIEDDLVTPDVLEPTSLEGQQAQHADLPAASMNGLTEAEAAALDFMREEEKLAHDVYIYLYELWGQRTFQNIAASEQTHTQSVLELLERYGLEDPASEEIGVFNNSDLQDLYNQLVAQGSQSLTEALKVGAAIEEIDILDLEARLQEVASADIQQVFENLRNGSINHLQAFVRVLANQAGETYQPQYLSEATYEAYLGVAQGNGQGGYRGGRP